jgi:CheY-like chemotaxis protein
MVTVLLVDDSKLARIVAGKAIAALQPEWSRVEAANAEEALDAVSKHSVDLAVLDFNMPGKDGLALAAELRQAYPNMPIAIVTANLQNEVIARARELNASFVGKPVTEDAMRGFLNGAALRLRQAGA